MKLAIRTLVLAVAVVATAGCAGLDSALLAAVVPSAAPAAAPAAGTTPTTTTGTPAITPAATPAATATAMPMADAPVMAKDPSECKATKDDSDKDNGLPSMGGYNNQYLPKGWNGVYTSEAAVTAAIDKIKDADWACFQKFYPGATTIYKKRTGG